jgi:hypothetical protein
MHPVRSLECSTLYLHIRFDFFFSFRNKIIPAHERFAHLLVEKPSFNELSSTPIKKIASPADLRRIVQVTENERV